MAGVLLYGFMVLLYFGRSSFVILLVGKVASQALTALRRSTYFTVPSLEIIERLYIDNRAQTDVTEIEITREV